MNGALTPSQVQQRLIRVVVQTPDASKRELREIARQLGDVNKSLGALNQTSRILQSIWGAQLFGFAVSELAEMADTMTLLSARATIFSKEGTNVNAVVADLINLTREVRGPLNDIAESFARIQLSTASLGVEVESQIALTEVLAKSFKLSGATSAEAANSMIQLGQAFQRGSLRGQELNSVLTQNAILAKALTDEAKRVNSDVRTLAENGYFTNQKVFGIIREAVPQIITQFEKLPATFSDIFNRIRTEVTVFAGTINEKLGISSGIYEGLNYMFSVVPELTNKFIALGVAVTVVGVAFQSWSIITALAPAIKTLLFLLAPFVANLGVMGTILAGLKAAIAAVAGVLFSWVGVAIAAGGAIFYLVNSFLEAYGGVKNLDIVTQALRLTWDNFKSYSMLGLIEAFKVLGLTMRAALIFFTAGISEITPLGKLFDSTADKLNKYSEELQTNIYLNDKYKASLRDQVAARSFQTPELSEAEKMTAKIKQIMDEMNKLRNAGGAAGGKVLTIAQQIGRLNAEFAKTGNFDRYNERMKILEKMQLDQQLEKGSISLRKYNLEIERNKLEEWQRKLDNARGSLGEFAAAANTFKIKELKDKFDSAKISVGEFYAKVAEISDDGPIDLLDEKALKILKEMNVEVGLFSKGWENAGVKISYGLGIGLRQYTEEIKGLTSQSAEATKAIAGNLEDTLVDAFAKGKDTFADFSNFIIQELTRIVIRLTIMKPLLESISNLMQQNELLGFASGLAGTYGGGGTGSAVMNNPYGVNLGTPQLTTQPYTLKSGLATYNTYANNYDIQDSAQGYVSKSGGLNVTVNNYTNSDVQVTETTGSDGSRNLDFVIESKVNKGFAEGKFDNAMRNNYGIPRRGQ